MKVCALVVTHNRRHMLTQCLAALAGQTRPADHVLVVDNASADGTAELLTNSYPDIETLRLERNGGGAGGFHYGLRHAHDAGFDWVWLLDDDTLPEPECLQTLLTAAPACPGPTPALLASKVIWTDGRLHPMNYVAFERESTARVIEASQLGLMPLRTATFVSLLVHRYALDRHGLPLRRYFLWGDDIEYTARILRHERGYLVPASVAVHKTERPYTAITTSDDRFYFHVRNTLYMLRSPAWRASEKPSLLFSLIMSVGAYLNANRFAVSVLPIILRGLRDGLKAGAPTPSHP
ncbi:MAG: glycosyltransferase family 2 protein [Actinomycetota bacterium]|nr:glycosyltransferase family 2 protein [Actinomycetota bacterium]